MLKFSKAIRRLDWMEMYLKAPLLINIHIRISESCRVIQKYSVRLMSDLIIDIL